MLQAPLRALEQAAHVDADQRRRHDAEGRQRAVASADVGIAREDVPEAVLARELLEARAGIGDRGEVAAVCRRARRSARTATAARSCRRTSRRRGTASAAGRSAPARRAPSPRRSSRARAGAGVRAASRTSAAAPRAPARSRPCRAARRRAMPSSRTPSANACSSSSCVEHPLGDRQPAEPVGDLGRARPAPTASRRCALAFGRIARRRCASPARASISATGGLSERWDAGPRRSGRRRSPEDRTAAPATLKGLRRWLRSARRGRCPASRRQRDGGGEAIATGAEGRMSAQGLGSLRLTLTKLWLLSPERLWLALDRAAAQRHWLLRSPSSSSTRSSTTTRSPRARASARTSPSATTATGSSSTATSRSAGA